MDRIRYIHLSELYFRVMWIFALMLYILIPLQSGAVSFVYRGIVLITFGCCFLLFLMALRKNRIFVRNKEIVYIILLVVTILISFLLNDGAISFDPQIIGVLGFIEMPVAIMLMDCLDYSEKNTKFVLRINILIAIVFSILSVTRYAYSGILDSLYLGYSNPNATAIYLLLNQAILIIFLPTIRQLLLKCLIVGLCIYEEYLIYLTDSRTCLIVSLVMVVYFFFGKNIKIPKWVIIVAMFFPLVFLLTYSNMYASGKYMDLQILGKEFYSGREVYFLEQINQLSENYLFGNVRLHYFTNMHNGPLAIIASCGILGYIWWFLFYYGTIRRYYSNATSKLQYMALVAILGVFIHSSSEAALIVSGAHYSIIVATFYWILKGKTNRYGNKREKY